uniref:Ranatuerin-9 n=1 Tax=Aquarana catesbeiana TaxID=8400 RepID=TP9_AQUCT|nr:RecName: Full=Ranatuerin-9; AltName: Full=Temporin [Aquarana catesbeiana]
FLFPLITSFLSKVL